MERGTPRRAGRRPQRATAPVRTARAALLFTLAAVPLAASSAQDATGSAPLVDTASEAAAESGSAVTPFASHFIEVIDPLGPDHDNVDLAVPPDAVDLDSFEPPIEEEPAARSLGSGVASYYGRRFHGRLTANGERFNMRALTAAHRTLPFGSIVRVTNPRNGQSVTVRINDRGPFSRGRTIDLSRAAAEQIGLIRRGHGTVELELLAP